MSLKLTNHQLIQLAKRGEDGLVVIRSYFKRPENILQYAWFCFGDEYIKSESPEFHQELLDLITASQFCAIAAPRGFAKSTIINLVYISWCIANQRWHYGLIISDSFTQAVEQLDALSSALQNSARFKLLYGDLSTDRWSRGDIVTKTGIRVQAKSQGMKIRGLRFRQYRPEFIAIDDLENDEIVAKSERRLKLRDWFKKNLIPAMSKTHRQIVYIGTILHHDSLLMNAINKNKEFSSWTTRLFKAINIDKDGNQYSLWPSYWPVEDLISMRDDPTYAGGYLGSLVFSQEYQNEPFSDEDAIIKSQWIKTVPALPPSGLLRRRIVTADPAISKKETADYFAKAFGCTDAEGNVYIGKLGNDRFSFEEGLEDIRKWDKELDPEFTAIEEVAFQAAIGQSLKGVPTRSIKRDKDKVRRAIAISKYFEAGKVFIVDGIKHFETAYNQLIEFPSSSHDDLVDVIVDVVELLLNQPIGSYGNRTKKPVSEKHLPPSQRRAHRTRSTSGIMNQRF